MYLLFAEAHPLYIKMNYLNCSRMNFKMKTTLRCREIDLKINTVFNRKNREKYF